MKRSWSWTCFNSWRGIALVIAFDIDPSDRCSWTQKRKCACTRVIKKTICIQAWIQLKSLDACNIIAQIWMHVVAFTQCVVIKTRIRLELKLIADDPVHRWQDILNSEPMVLPEVCFLFNIQIINVLFLDNCVSVVWCKRSLFQVAQQICRVKLFRGSMEKYAIRYNLLSEY